MKRNKTSISKAKTYKEIGEFWDRHDLAEYWGRTKPKKFEVDIQSEVTYYALDNELSARIQAISRKRGISPDTLLNLWVQEKLQKQKA
ncbi:MAG: BrnA antitoxin family protein [candidate division WOR-3 bacterium]|nr:BrnA antitoxin family protein [candidate division WOR-3 bacterium]